MRAILIPPSLIEREPAEKRYPHARVEFTKNSEKNSNQFIYNMMALIKKTGT
jgi:hypothetical protein